MALFRKKQSQTEIPELQEYYATQGTESTGKAWFVAIASLIVTIAVLVGFFAAGRWIYRTVTNKDDSKPSTTTSQANDTSKDTTTNGAGSTATGTVTAPATSNGISGSINGSTTAKPAQGVSPTQSGTTNSSAAAAVTSVPNTGPGDTIALFIALFAVSFVAHRSFLKKSIK
jgi:cytoskeletal protein RodZ